MEESADTIVEERKELMVSITSKDPILKTAYFLKPSATFAEDTVADHPFQFHSDSTLTFNIKEWPLKITYGSWRAAPNPLWKEWVTKMAALHAPTWRKAGIYEAVIGSTYTIKRNDDIVLGVAERWCPETKTFSFPWGEATITLEDVMVMMGYSVLGCSVLSPLESPELEEIKERLEEARREICGTAAKKASDSLWMRKFMNSGDDLEHEAFLAMWLSRYVLQTVYGVIGKCQLPVAVNLARGIRVALAPAVLATIYRDLSVLKDGCLQKLKITDKYELNMNIPSPFQLVQVWVWERFPDLRPVPSYIGKDQPRLARWQNVNKAVENVRLVLDSAKESFAWRPYAESISNWSLPKYYGETDMLLSVDSLLHHEFISYVRCVRVSELMGLECEEQYLPNRVGLQFGIDQDLPGFVSPSDQSPAIGFDYYSRPISDVKLYIPSRLREGCFTSRYLDWWNQPVSGFQDRTAKIYERSSGSKTTPRKKQNTSGKCSLRLKVSNWKRKYKDVQNSREPTLQRSKKSVATSMELKDSTAESSRTKVSNSCTTERRQIDVSVPATSKKKSAFQIKKELQDSPYPPGFPCCVVEAEKPRKMELKDSTSESSSTNLSDSCSIQKRQIDESVSASLKKKSTFEVKRELEDSSYPLGFACHVVKAEKFIDDDLTDSDALQIPKLQKEVIYISDDEDSIDEDHLTVSEALRIHKLQKKAIYISDDEHSSDEDHLTNAETLEIHKKKNVVRNLEDSDGEDIIIGNITSPLASSQNNVGSPAREEVGTSGIKKDKGDDDATEVMSFGIEARIRRLEKVISDMFEIDNDLCGRRLLSDNSSDTASDCTIGQLVSVNYILLRVLMVFPKSKVGLLCSKA